jgi:hypothetical protein
MMTRYFFFSAHVFCLARQRFVFDCTVISFSHAQKVVSKAKMPRAGGGITCVQYGAFCGAVPFASPYGKIVMFRKRKNVTTTGAENLAQLLYYDKTRYQALYCATGFGAICQFDPRFPLLPHFRCSVNDYDADQPSQWLTGGGGNVLGGWSSGLRGNLASCTGYTVYVGSCLQEQLEEACKNREMTLPAQVVGVVAKQRIDWRRARLKCKLQSMFCNA